MVHSLVSFQADVSEFAVCRSGVSVRFKDRGCTVCAMAPPETMGWQTQLQASLAGLHAGAMREVQSLLDDSDPVQESGPSVIPVRLS